MKNQSSVILLLTGFMLSGCTINLGSSSLSSNLTSVDSSTSTSTSISSSLSDDFGDNLPSTPESDDLLPKPEMAEYTAFWDENTDLSFTLNITTENLQNINDCGKDKNDPLNELYFPGELTIIMNGVTYTIAEVGVRTKGNVYSRLEFMAANRIVGPFHFRLKFDETWTESYYASYGLQKSWSSGDPAYDHRQDRRLFDMKALEFKWNRSNDPSMITQAFSFNLFGEANLLSPKSTLTKLSINSPTFDTNMGVYMINEVIDKTLIRRFFPKAESQGDLYKCLWPIDLRYTDSSWRTTIYSTAGVYTVNPDVIGVEDTINNYHPTYDLKTNETTSNHLSLINLFRALNESTGLPENQVKAALESVVDMDSFLRYAAVSYLTGNPDDMRNNVNNMFVYFHPNTGKAYFIPYDYDWSLGVAWDTNLGMSVAQQNPHYNSSPTQWNYINNPLYWYTIISENTGDVNFSNLYPMVSDYQNQYDVYVREYFANQQFTMARYDEMYSAYKGTYGTVDALIESSTYFANTDTFDTYYGYISQSIAAAYPVK